MNVEGKVVLVVGASSGIGREVTRRLARRGALLAVSARRAALLDTLAAEIEADGGRCRTFPADVADEDDAARMVDEVVASYGRIDAVLLNVGGAPALDLRTMTAADAKAWMASNYDVTVNPLFPVVAHMRANGGGLVVHTGSLAGFAGIPLQAPYSAAKAATRMLMDAARIELADDRIRVTTVYPGFVSTERTADDGMPSPWEITPAQAADHVVRAIASERWDVLFPRRTAWLVRLLTALPKRLGAVYLRRELLKARQSSTQNPRPPNQPPYDPPPYDPRADGSREPR